MLTYWPYRLAIRNNFVLSLLGVCLLQLLKSEAMFLRLRSFGEGGCSSYPTAATIKEKSQQLFLSRFYSIN